MQASVKAFLFLGLIVVAASSLAVFVHDWNERLATPVVTPAVQTQSTSTAPAIVVIFSPTSTAPVATSTPQTPTTLFMSKDKVTSAFVVTEPGDLLDDNHTFVVSGTSTAFENQMHWRLVLEDKTILTEGSVYVSSTDAGVPGPFQITGGFPGIPHLASGQEAQSGTLEIYEPSPKDGTPLHLVDVPLQFQLGWPD